MDALLREGDGHGAIHDGLALELVRLGRRRRGALVKAGHVAPVEEADLAAEVVEVEAGDRFGPNTRGLKKAPGNAGSQAGTGANIKLLICLILRRKNITFCAVLLKCSSAHTQDALQAESITACDADRLFLLLFLLF